MTDDRGDLESAKDWLADLPQPADTGNESPEDEVEAVDSGGEDPGPQPARSPQWMLDRSAELIDLDRVDKWWSRSGVGTLNYSLVEDGNEVATISTVLEPDENFGSGVKCRHTQVRFESGRWRISTHAPGPRQDKKRMGISYKAPWTRGDRVVEVKDDGGEQIAYLTNPVKTRNPEVKTTGEYSLTLKKKPLRGVWIGEALTIERGKGVYVLTPTSPVPLEAALLHWHVILGDFSVPSSGLGG